MREVLIDVTRLLGRFMKGRLPTGVDRVSLAYLNHYGSRAQAVVRWSGQYLVLSCDASEKLFKLLLLGPTDGFNRGIWWTLANGAVWGWKDRDCAGKFLFNTGHSGLELKAYPFVLKRQRVKPVFFVHDLIPLSHPEYCREGEGVKHVKRLNTMLDVPAGIIANSNSTLDELVAYAKRNHKPAPPAVVAPLAPGIPLLLPQAREVESPYFVMLGTIEPRKNHWLVLQLWRRLIERLGDKAPRLMVIGQRGWECQNVTALLDRCEILRGFVTEHTSCTDAELVTHLQHAQALLFPSFAEGYGMPLVEALALGVPIIASDLPAFREVSNGIPDYLDPLDGKRWGEVIEDYSSPRSQLRSAQLQRLAGFKAPTWRQHFIIVDEFLEHLRDSRV